MSFRKVVTLIVEAVLGLFMLYTAYTLFAWTPEVITKARDALNYPQWYWQLAGVLAVISAITLLVGLVNRVVGAFSALWTVAYFIVASASHLVRADWANFYLPLIFLVPFAILVWLRWEDAKPIRARLGMA
ncbi:MAG TPA: DoxX family protein [Ktedonobacterales bacterium]|nr:DoxX family protein [Ktedonobacterales bacterium]